MTLKGFICPDGTKNTAEYCLNSCPNPCIPPHILYSIYNERKTNYHQDDVITITTLLGCLRETYFERKYEYYSNPLNVWYPFRGIVLHKGFEACGLEGWIVEKRYFKKFDGIEISGQIDAYDSKKRILYDIKTVHDGKLFQIQNHGIDMNHLIQVNAYRILMNEPVEKIKIIYLSMMNIAVTGTSYNGVTLPNVPLLNDQDIIDLLIQRANIFKNCYENNTVPPPADSETRRWKCSDFCSVKDYCNKVGDVSNDIQISNFDLKDFKEW